MHISDFLEVGEQREICRVADAVLSGGGDYADE